MSSTLVLAFFTYYYALYKNYRLHRHKPKNTLQQRALCRIHPPWRMAEDYNINCSPQPHPYTGLKIFPGPKGLKIYLWLKFKVIPKVQYLILSLKYVRGPWVSEWDENTRA